MRKRRVGVLARPARGADQIDFAGTIAQAARTETALARDAALDAARVAHTLHAPIEPGAAVRFDARAAILEQHPHHLGTPDAVDDVRHARDLVETRGQRLDLGVGVTQLGGGDTVPVVDVIEP